MNKTDKNLDQASDELLASQAMSLVKFDDLLNDEVKHRLVESRQRAVNRLIDVQEARPAMAGGFFSWFDHTHHRQWLQYRTLAAVFSVMIVTFFAVQHFGLSDDLENSDAFLLAAELPPEAFADKGFDTWIVAARN